MRGAVEKRGSTWTVRYDEPGADGRRQRRRGGFATRREAQAFLTDTLARVGDGSYVAPSKLTVGQWLEQWLPAVQTTVKPQTGKKYETVVRCHLSPQVGSVRLSALAGAHLTALYGELAREGLAAGTIRNVHAVISRALSDAVREGKVNRNVAKLARPPRRAPTRATAWTAAEVQRFLEHVSDDRLFALWRLAAVSGMRRGELLGTTWRALDLENGKLAVDQQLLPDRTFAEPKSARGRRTISLDEETVETLRRHRDDAATRTRASPPAPMRITTSSSPTSSASRSIPSWPASGFAATAKPPVSRVGACTHCATPRRP